MNNIIAKVSKKDRTVYSSKTYIGVMGENLQEKLVFVFEDEFVNGVARLETEIDGVKNFINMDKEDESYSLPIKNVLTKNGSVSLQLVINTYTEEDETPLFKSEIFKLYCKASIDAIEEMPDGYELWIDTANKKLAEMDNINVEAVEGDDGALYISVTNRKGKTTRAKIIQGKNGIDGKDGAIQYYAGSGITISPTNVISSEGERYYAGNNIEISSSNVINAIINLSNYYNKPEVDALISSLQSVTLLVVSSLPSTGVDGTIYLVPVYNPTDPSIIDYYTQHIYSNDSWVNIGTTQIDLSDYYTKDETDDLLDEKQNLFEEISEITSINDNTILSSVDLNNNQISGIKALVLKNYIGRQSTNLQYETLPVINLDNLGSVVQYIGEDTPTRKKGFWYQAVREYSWYAWVNPITSTNVYLANREPGIGDNLHELIGGVMTETDLVVARVDEYNIYDNNNTRYTRNSSSDRDMTYKWEILNDELSKYINDEGYIKENSINGAISTGVSNDFTGNRVVITTPLGKLSWSDITHEELYKLSGVTSNIQTQFDNKQDELSAGTRITSVTDNTDISKVDLTNKKVTPMTAKVLFDYMWKKIYPVGAIYISTSSSSPATLFGGTWEAVGDGYYLRASSSGGGNTLNEQLPNVTGSFRFSGGSQGHAEVSSPSGAFRTASAGNLTYPWPTDNTSGGARIVNFDLSYFNSDLYKTNGAVQPKSLKVYMWKRTA